MNEHNIDVTQKLLYEYGSAIRGDWSSLDGRSVRGGLETIAGILDITSDAVNVNIVSLRDSLGICRAGNGQWEIYCEDYKCECLEME